jgi:hypothetical protein
MTGQVLPLVIAVLVVLVVLLVVTVVVVIGLRARTGRLRREKAVADAEAHVVETPPADVEEPEPATTSSTGSPPRDPGEQPTSPDAEQGTPAGAAGGRRAAAQAAPGPAEGGERRVTKPPAPGVDSALAGLDAGQFTSSLSPTAGRGRPVIPLPSPPADDVAAEDTKAEPPYPGAAAARPDGSSPSSEYPIKANLAVKRYYTDDSPYFARTTAQVWFRSVEDAERAGFTAAR